MDADKYEFYRLAAKRFAASSFIYKVDALVHVEGEDDIWFWRQILARFRPCRYKFLPGSKNEYGRNTTGCIQCLKYKDFLTQRFFICIDSDLRYLLDEDITAKDGILQTYTYSWESHCCLAEKLQRSFEELTGLGDVFDFRLFLRRYSEILYRPFLLMLYCERTGLSDFNREGFKRLISLQYKKGDELDNGGIMLDRLKEEVALIIDPIIMEKELDLSVDERRLKDKGIDASNLYLYVRGHALYNLINSVGSKLCEESGIDFEQNILKSLEMHDAYDAMLKIEKDVAVLRTIRQSL